MHLARLVTFSPPSDFRPNTLSLPPTHALKQLHAHSLARAAEEVREHAFRLRTFLPTAAQSSKGAQCFKLLLLLAFRKIFLVHEILHPLPFRLAMGCSRILGAIGPTRRKCARRPSFLRAYGVEVSRAEAAGESAMEAFPAALVGYLLLPYRDVGAVIVGVGVVSW